MVVKLQLDVLLIFINHYDLLFAVIPNLLYYLHYQLVQELVLFFINFTNDFIKIINFNYLNSHLKVVQFSKL